MSSYYVMLYGAPSALKLNIKKFEMRAHNHSWLLRTSYLGNVSFLKVTL